MVTGAGDEIDTSVFLFLLKAYWHPLKIGAPPTESQGSRHKGLAQSVLRKPRADVKPLVGEQRQRRAIMGSQWVLMFCNLPRQHFLR